MNGRVNGQLAVTRALGDSMLTPYVSHVPYVTKVSEVFSSSLSFSGLFFFLFFFLCLFSLLKSSSFLSFPLIDIFSFLFHFSISIFPI